MCVSTHRHRHPARGRRGRARRAALVPGLRPARPRRHPRAGRRGRRLRLRGARPHRRRAARRPPRARPARPASPSRRASTCPASRAAAGAQRRAHARGLLLARRPVADLDGPRGARRAGRPSPCSSRASTPPRTPGSRVQHGAAGGDRLQPRRPPARRRPGRRSTCWRTSSQAVGGEAEVLVDGGIRRGTDVLKALALGARAVLVGRPVLWGLAWDGEAGARWVLDTLQAELQLDLMLLGAPSPAAVSRHHVR